MGSNSPNSIFGERLLAPLVDELATTDPSRILYSFAKTPNPADGFRDVDASTFARAVNRCAWYMEENLGRPTTSFPTLLYMGPQDLVYAVLIMASNKVGYKLLLSSPRNTLNAHLSLLEKTDCNTFLMPPVFPLPIVKQIQDARPMKVITIPGINHWLEDGTVPLYPYIKTFAEAKYDPFVVLHTSGSTGIPKPITQTQSTNNLFDALNTLLANGDTSVFPLMCHKTRLYVGFPLFHCAGIVCGIIMGIFLDVTPVLGPFPPSADIINDILVHGNVQNACVAPSLLVEMANDPEYLDNLAKLSMIVYGGGPVPKATGQAISSRTRLMNVLGSTECSAFPNQWVGQEYWEYLSYPDFLGQEFRPLDNGLYEHIIVRDEKLSKFQGIFKTFPHLDEWNMQDLYEKHPTKENVWLYKGRMDDIIVFSNGEKLNPIDMEDIINADPAVSSALITGQAQFQASLLVEAVTPPASAVEADTLVEAIWPSVAKANQSAPAHGQIHRHMIVFTAPDKPMLRAGKGTVQRQATISQYQVELDALYGESSTKTMPSGILSSSDVSDANLAQAVKGIVCSTMHLEPATTDETADLFSLGLDSLQTVAIIRRLNEIISKGNEPFMFTTRDLYANPTIASLVPAMSCQPVNARSRENAASLETIMQELFDLHTSGFPMNGRAATPRPSSSTLLLTGATGSLGSYVLHFLSQSPSVSHVYCLSRGTASAERIQKSLTERQLTVSANKVTYLDAALSESYLGLSVADYKTLLHQITDVIHSAWPVNFNMPVHSFSDQIAAVRRLVDFSLLSTHDSKLTFVSSVSSVGALAEPAEEIVYNDWEAAIPNGYGQSKLLAERIIDTAVNLAGLDATICRVGQIAGSIMPGGMWSRQEWLPSLLASSAHLGLLPDSLGPSDDIDWVPVDVVAQGITDIALAGTSNAAGRAAVYHIANASTIPWRQVSPTVLEHMSENRNVKMVSLQEWAKALRESESTTQDVSTNPAIKLLEFYEEMASPEPRLTNLKVRNVLDVSPALKSVGAVQKQWMAKWLKEWF